MSPHRITTKLHPLLYRRIRQILESAQAGAARSVNTAQVVAYWLIGREIVEEEQRGKRRAEWIRTKRVRSCNHASAERVEK